MEFPVVRRKANTYGKGARKILVHDLFDVGSQPSIESSTAQHLQSAPVIHNKDAGVPQYESDPGLRRATPYERAQTKERPSVTNSPSLTLAEPFDIFATHPLDDDSGRRKMNPTVKKRQMAPVSSALAMTDSRPTKESKDSMLDVQRPAKSGVVDKSMPTKHKSANQIKTVPASGSLLHESPVALKRSSKTAAESPAKRATTSKATSPGAAALSKAYRSKGLRVSSGSSSDLSDASNPSLQSQKSTPKRKRDVSDEGVSPPTPSDLHLKLLRLTPGSGSQRSPFSTEDEEMADDPIPTPRHGRKRLIDRLDAPRTPSNASRRATAIIPEQGSQTVSEPVVDTSPKHLSKATQDPPRLERQSSSGAGVPPVRARATYAKQRSYLSNMIDDSDSLPASSSQTSSQQNYSQSLSFTSVAPHMELDMEDSDEADSFSQVKSIHELRRGGAVKQFDLYVQSNLEDIESSSKSLRISGLLQLASKLSQDTFRRHFQDSGNFQRFTDAIKEGLDEISAILVAYILQCLLSAEKSSSRSLPQAWGVLCKLPGRLIAEPRSISQVAKDRSHNLSKALIRDIVDFEGKIPKPLATSWTSVDNILLGAIESAQRRFISTKEQLPRLPQKFLNEILSTFTKTQQEVTEIGLEGQVEKVRLLLSLLEIACASPEIAELALSPSRLPGIGRTVAGIMREARLSQPGIEQSCLRLIVSLSNNDGEICGALSKGSLIDTVFQVVDDHFLTLAGLAALEMDFENARLDSVILAVGCLLNLAECSDEARVKMLAQDTKGKDLVSRLVDIFNSHADQASEVRASQRPPNSFR